MTAIAHKTAENKGPSHHFQLDVATSRSLK